MLTPEQVKQLWIATHQINHPRFRFMNTVQREALARQLEQSYLASQDLIEHRYTRKFKSLAPRLR